MIVMENKMKIAIFLLFVIAVELGYLSWSQYNLPKLADINNAKTDEAQEAVMNKSPVLFVHGSVNANITNPDEINNN